MVELTEQEQNDLNVKRATEEFINYIQPFGYGNIQAGANKCIAYNIDVEDWANYCEEWAEDTGTPFKDLDVCGLLYEMILSKATNLIIDLTGLDISEEELIIVMPNYMCSQFDYSDSNKQELINRLKDVEHLKDKLEDMPLLKTFLEDIDISNKDLGI